MCNVLGATCHSNVHLLCLESVRQIVDSVGTLQYYSFLCRKVFEVCAPVTSGSHTTPCKNLNQNTCNQRWMWEGEEKMG